MEPLFPNDIWAFRMPEQEEVMEYKIRWKMPKDKSKLFWEITCMEDPEFKEYASKLEFNVPSRADYNRIYASGFLEIDDDKVAHFNSHAV